MVRPTKHAVFFDRDGVLNEAVVLNGKPYPPRDLSEFVIAQGARAALYELKREGFLLIVVTNQPDIARGNAKRADVAKSYRVSACDSRTAPRRRARKPRSRPAAKWRRAGH